MFISITTGPASRLPNERPMFAVYGATRMDENGDYRDTVEIAHFFGRQAARNYAENAAKEFGCELV